MYLLYRIAVRAKWQSSHVSGNSTSVFVKGNRKFGNEFVNTGESLLDLSRKVYYIGSQLFLFMESIMENKINSEIKKYESSVKKKKSNYSWIIKITLFATLISFIFSYSSELVITKLNVILSVVFLFFVIILGVIFDMVGVSITTVSITPFHSMNAKKLKGAKDAIKLISNAEKVSSFCNDVVGDICGILSGSISILISVSLASTLNINASLMTLIITSLVAGLTIGGKAFGKSIAINKNVYIVYKASRIISFFKGGK